MGPPGILRRAMTFAAVRPIMGEHYENPEVMEKQGTQGPQSRRLLRTFLLEEPLPSISKPAPSTFTPDIFPSPAFKELPAPVFKETGSRGKSPKRSQATSVMQKT